MHETWELEGNTCLPRFTGEGVASIILKPLPAALRDGDRIHAVVRETGLNQDGKTPTITSPSMDAQETLIREVYRRAGLRPSVDTGYVEAHMTGTPTGDPIEAEALARTFGAGRDENDPVIVGSVKPNIGHTEPVSGLAAILKTIFALREGVIPPNTNYKNTNPKIPLKKWRLTVSPRHHISVITRESLTDRIMIGPYSPYTLASWQAAPSFHQ